MSNPPQSRGFTLVEVLVALIIVALAAAAAMEAISGASDATVVLRDRSFAQWIALNRIAEERVALQRPPNGETKGVVEFAGRRWEWRQKIEDYQQSFVSGLRQLEVSVRLAPDAAAAVGANDSGNYLVTVVSVLGRAVAQPRGDDPDWEPTGAPQQPGPNNPGGPPPTSPPPSST